MGIPKSVHSAIFGDDEDDGTKSPDEYSYDPGVDKTPAHASIGGLGDSENDSDQDAKSNAIKAMTIHFGGSDDDGNDQEAGNAAVGTGDPHHWDNLWKYMAARKASKGKGGGGGGMMGGMGGMDMGSMGGGGGGGGA